MFFPLKTFVCEKCFLVQLGEFKSPEEIFENYAYFSSFSKTWVKHAKDYVDSLVKKFNFNKLRKLSKSEPHSSALAKLRHVPAFPWFVKTTLYLLLGVL